MGNSSSTTGKHRGVKAKRVHDVWDIARASKVMGATTDVTLDFEHVTERVRSKIVSALQNYPDKHPGGYRSHARKLYDYLCEFYDLPSNRIDEDGIYLNKLYDEALYEETYNIVYADALAKRMEHGAEWLITRLEARCSKELGKISYYGMSHQTNQLIRDSGVVDRIHQYMMKELAPKLEKALTTVQFGGKIKFQLEM